MSDADTQVAPGYTQERGFWELMATALLLGLVGAAAGLVFLGVTGVGADWYVEPGLGWFDGEWWVVAVSAVSLIGGASLGPEVALGQMGGGTAVATAFLTTSGLKLAATRARADQGATG